MTTIKYTHKDGTFRYEAKGHAEYAKAGEPDIVCSAVSAMNCLLAELVQRAQHTEPPEISVEPGKVRIACTPRNFERMRLHIQFEAVLLGLQMIAEEYPDYVRVEIV